MKLYSRNMNENPLVLKTKKKKINLLYGQELKLSITVIYFTKRMMFKVFIRLIYKTKERGTFEKDMLLVFEDLFAQFVWEAKFVKRCQCTKE